MCVDTIIVLSKTNKNTTEGCIGLMLSYFAASKSLSDLKLALGIELQFR